MKQQHHSSIRELFNSLKDMVFILDCDGAIMEVNDAVISTLGFTQEELANQLFINIHPTEYREAAVQLNKLAVDGKIDSIPIPLTTKKGEHVAVETRIAKSGLEGKDFYVAVSRNMAEVALSNEKFLRVFEVNQLMMTISEIETGVILNANRAFLQRFGYKDHEVIGNSVRNLNIFNDYAEREELAGVIREKGIIENSPITVYDKNKEPIHCLYTASKIYLQGKQLLLASAMDVTHLKKIEKKLTYNLKQQTLLADIAQILNSSLNVRSIMDTILEQLGVHTNVSRVYIFEDSSDGFTTDNTFEWCNAGISPQKEELQGIPYEVIPSWKKILFEEGKVFSTNINELPEDIIQVLEPQNIKSILVFPLYVQGYFFGFIGFDECTRSKNWEQDEIELLRAASSIISNAFERSKYQAQLHSSEAQLKLAIENTEAGVWDWNIKTGSVHFNSIWCKMLGYDITEVEPNVSAWEKIVHPDDMPLAMKELTEHLEGRSDSYCSTHRLKTKQGTWKWVIDKGKVIEYDTDGSPLRAIGTHIDIDNQKRIEEQFKIANATKDKFFSIIGHDLRGPIGAIMQIAELVSEKGKLDEDTMFDFLKDQKQLSRNTFLLLENLLYWSRFNSHEIKPSPSPIMVGKIIEEVVNLFSFDLTQKKVAACINLLSTEAAFADENMVRLAIRNLFSNAVKFSPTGEEVQITVENVENALRISVTNTGIGISDENMQRIFAENDFYTSYGTAREKGSGLGLKLCKSFVELNNGSLTITSIPNEKTTVSFTLPVA